MVLVFLLALPLAWIAYEMHDVQRQREAIDAIEARGGYVYPYLYHWEETNWWQAFRLRVLLKLFGEEEYPRIRGIQLVESQQVNALVPLLSRFPYLEHLTLPSAALDDRSVQVIAKLPKLRELVLIDNPVSVEQMSVLTQSATISEITLEGASATDANVQQLPQLAALQNVTLIDPLITDRGMAALGICRQLMSLDIDEAPQVTNHGFAELKNCPLLWNVQITGTQIDSGCIDVLREMPLLNFVVIVSSDPSTSFGPEGKWRLDTFTPVRVKSTDDPFSDTAPALDQNVEFVQIVTVNEQVIALNRIAVSSISDGPN